MTSIFRRLLCLLLVLPVSVCSICTAVFAGSDLSPEVMATSNCAVLSGTMLLPCEIVRVRLFVRGEDTPAHTAQVSSEQYRFENVIPGEYILSVSCDGGVPREYAVTLVSGENTQNVTLSRPGDVNEDRDMNVADVSLIYTHIKGTRLLEGYHLDCADMNHDGQVDIVDTAIIYSLTKSRA